jgi:hypothetical protein
VRAALAGDDACGGLDHALQACEAGPVDPEASILPARPAMWRARPRRDTTFRGRRNLRDSVSVHLQRRSNAYSCVTRRWLKSDSLILLKDSAQCPLGSVPGSWYKTSSNSSSVPIRTDM